MPLAPNARPTNPTCVVIRLSLSGRCPNLSTTISITQYFFFFTKRKTVLKEKTKERFSVWAFTEGKKVFDKPSIPYIIIFANLLANFIYITSIYF